MLKSVKVDAWIDGRLQDAEPAEERLKCTCTAAVICDLRTAIRLMRQGREHGMLLAGVRLPRRYDDGIRFIRPVTVPATMWAATCQDAEHLYRRLIETGADPEDAVMVLPMGTAVRVIMSSDSGGWKRFLDEVTSLMMSGVDDTKQMRAAVRELRSCVGSAYGLDTGEGGADDPHNVER